MLRTANFISAVNLGLKITTKQWLDESIKAGNLLGVDETSENEPGFNLQTSLEEARKGRQATDPPSETGSLFQGY